MALAACDAAAMQGIQFAPSLLTTKSGATKEASAAELHRDDEALAQNDCLATYIVTRSVACSRELIINGAEDIIKKLATGTFVDVVEVQRCVMSGEERIRGRILEPAGWITLLNIASTQRWAYRSLLCPEGHALERKNKVANERCSDCQCSLDLEMPVLHCKECASCICSDCVAVRACSQLWTFTRTADSTVHSLGFTPAWLPPARIVLDKIHKGSWADTNGVKDGDELLAVNNRCLGKTHPSDLKRMFAEERPLNLLFAYRPTARSVPTSTEASIGTRARSVQSTPTHSTRSRSVKADAMEAHSTLSKSVKADGMEADAQSEKIAVAIVVNNVKPDALLASAVLRTAFDVTAKEVLEEATGSRPETVRLTTYSSTAVAIRCMINVRFLFDKNFSGDADELVAKLRSSKDFLDMANRRFKSLNDTHIEIPESICVEQVNADVDAGHLQVHDGGPVWPWECGITREQCRDLLRRLREDPNWDASNNVYKLVKDFIIPMTRGTGLSFALLKNQDAPKAVNVLVSHTWAENAEEFLETIDRSSCAKDVMFICALSVYQAEDALGPKISDQLGLECRDGLFGQVLAHIKKRSRSRTIRTLMQLLRGILPCMLAISLTLFYMPIIVWGCVPTVDMESCAVRIPQRIEGQSQPIEWKWLSDYEHDWLRASDWAQSLRACNYPVALALICIVSIGWFLVMKYDILEGRVLAVPCREVKLTTRLWCVHHILSAKEIGVPVVLAKTLNKPGKCKVRDAVCTNAGQRNRLWRDIDRMIGSKRDAYDRMDRTVRRLVRRGRKVSSIVVSWVLFFGLLRWAELRLATYGLLHFDSAALLQTLCLFGSLLGALLCGCIIGWMAQSASGRPRPCVVFAVALGLFAGGSSIIAVLVYMGSLRSAELGGQWTQTIDLLSDEALRFLDSARCMAFGCEYQSFFLGIAQTLLIAGMNLILVLLSSLFCHTFLSRHYVRCLVIAMCFMCTLVGSLLFVHSRFVEWQAEISHWSAIGVLYFTQICTRCIFPMSALLMGMNRWGIWLNGRPKAYLHTTRFLSSRSSDALDDAGV